MARKKPRWLRRDVLLVVHRQLIIEHRGSPGIRDEGLVDSALAHPENLFAYNRPTIFQLAAAYSFRIVRNHPFIDGNKRAAFMASYIFLGANGFELAMEEADAALAMERLAAHQLNERELAQLLKLNSKRTTA